MTEESKDQTPASPSPAPEGGGQPVATGESMLPLVIIVVMLVLLGGGIWWFTKHKNAGGGSSATSTSTSATDTAAPRPDPVIATVNGEDIHESEFNAAIELVPENMRAALATPQGKKQLLDELVQMKLLTAEAKKMKLEDDAQVKSRVTVAEENILSSAAVEKLAQQTQNVTLQQLYDRNKDQFETAKTRQIMVAYQGGEVPGKGGKPALADDAARARAAEIAAKLRSGADFAAVAKAESDEPGVAQTGGTIGDVRRGMLPPEVEKVLFTIPLNQISDPVKSPYAYHVFQVTARGTKTFDEMKPVLEQRGQTLRIKNMIDDLKKKAKITYSPDFLPPAVTNTP